MTKDELLASLAPVLDAVRAVDVNQPDEAVKALTAQFPIDGPVLAQVRAVLRAGVASNVVCDRSAPGEGGVGVVRFSRLAKDAGGFSVDAVHMSGRGGAHTHPNGEIDLCFAVDGAPRFDGQAPGWTVYPPGSWHVPTVAGGAMDILYFLPKGAIVFGAKPAS